MATKKSAKTEAAIALAEQVDKDWNLILAGLVQAKGSLYHDAKERSGVALKRYKDAT